MICRPTALVRLTACAVALAALGCHPPEGPPCDCALPSAALEPEAPPDPIAPPAPTAAPTATPTNVPAPRSQHLAAGTTASQLTEADRVLPGYSRLETATPEARLALDAALDLFAGRYQDVHALFDPALQASLPPGELGAIIRGVVNAHGPPSLVMDAWLSDIEEAEVQMPAAKVLLRMGKSDVRFRLLVVFNPNRSVRGLWLRPL